MKTEYKFALFFLVAIGLVLLTVLFLFDKDIAVLHPKGMIALKERSLLFFATLLMLIVVVPVFILAFIFSWRYRSNNQKAKYSPNLSHSHLAETLWWGVPCAIILVLSIYAWKKSHELDPFRPIENGTKPITIQVVALQWKWLFIYPEHEIASVNFIQIPVETPINFEITADAPMNSFWIPELSGQIYAMPRMKTELHVIADKVGKFRGSSANLSGKGFAGMTFMTEATSRENFDAWIQSIKDSSNALGLEEYQKLSEPSEYHPVAFYSQVKQGLFEQILLKYITPKSD